MHLVLHRLADRGALCVLLLAPSHLLRTILGGPSLGSSLAHWLGLGSGDGNWARPLLGPSVDSAGVVADLHRDKFDLFGLDSAPGLWVLDMFPSCVIVRWSLSLSDEDVTVFRSELDGAWAVACMDPTCTVISMDVSVPMEANLQAVACALVFRQGVQVKHVVMATRKRTPDEVECFPFRLASLQLCHRDAVGWLSSRTQPRQLRLCWIQFHAQGRCSPWTCARLFALGLPRTRLTL
jgi:hypothetical protein